MTVMQCVGRGVLPAVLKRSADADAKKVGFNNAFSLKITIFAIQTKTDIA